MDELQHLVKKYIKSNDDDYKKAKKIVDEREKLKEKIKKLMKQHNINKTNIVIDNKQIEYGFNIKYLKQIDTKSIPKEIREQYTMMRDYWYEYIKKS